MSNQPSRISAFLKQMGLEIGFFVYLRVKYHQNLYNYGHQQT